MLKKAARIVESYDTGVTLRQLFYQLVAANLLPNLKTFYQRLSSTTAKARRAGKFPALIDLSSEITRPRNYSSPEAALEHMRRSYRRDRTEGQKWTIFLGVEKAGLSAQLWQWFSEPLGIPHVALGGYASETLCQDVIRYIKAYDRPAVLIYAGDMDPSGEDIDRDFWMKVDCFEDVERVALHDYQVEDYQLVQNQIDAETIDKLNKDPRKKSFLKEHEKLMQYEVDGLDPNELRNLYQEAINKFWNAKTYRAVMAQEDRERQSL